MTTSLTSGLASRETCFHGPKPTYLLVLESKTRDLRRLAVAHTPITDFLELALVGVLPSRVRSRLGTWIAMLWTLNPCRPLTPFMFGIEIRWAELSGRSAPRSKMLPRSTKNASWRCPANTFRPPGRLRTALAASAG